MPNPDFLIKAFSQAEEEVAGLTRKFAGYSRGMKRKLAIAAGICSSEVSFAGACITRFGTCAVTR